MQEAPGKFGELQQAGTNVNLEEGSEVDITTKFTVGLEGSLGEAIGLGASYECMQNTHLFHRLGNTNASRVGSMTVNAAKSISRQGESSPKYNNRWVFWPKMVTTCGDMTSYDHYSRVGGPGGVAGAGGPVQVSGCFLDTVKTIYNYCTTTPFLNSDGEVDSMWEPSKLQIFTHLQSSILIVCSVPTGGWNSRSAVGTARCLPSRYQAETG
jgi:hypothetical protein